MDMRNTICIIMVTILLVVSFVMLPTMKTIHADVATNATNELLVKYSSDYRSMASTKILQDVETMESIAPEVELLTFSDDADMEAIRIQLENNPSIEYVEPNYERHLLTVLDDPYTSSQWWLPHVKAESMWKHVAAQKKKIVVAVIDSGIDMNHEDLKNRIEPGGYDFFSNTTMMTDLHGHGTKVAGVIAAEAGNGRGISGVAGPFEISIFPIKVLGSSGTGSTSSIIKALEYAIAKKVDVINLSLGGANSSAIENEVIQRAVRAGIVIVAAAGNDALKGNSVFYPASYENVISVGAVDENNSRSSFSNYNQYVDLVAPGERILTTFPKQSYNKDGGTSFSAPIVSGTVAMMKALKPQLSPSEIEDLLKRMAQDFGAPGYDSFYGHGVLDIEKLTDRLVGAQFVGDFLEMTVPITKEFIVSFNQELVLGKDYTQDVIVSRKSDGSERVTLFTTTVDPTTPTNLLIAPQTNWDFGEYYLNITTGVQSKDNKSLKKDVRMKFIVE